MHTLSVSLTRPCSLTCLLWIPAGSNAIYFNSIILISADQQAIMTYLTF